MTNIKKKTPLDILAFLTSAIFSPYITALVFIIVITYNSSQHLNQFLPWMTTFLLFSLILPGIYVLWQMEIGKIHDFHISDPNERKQPFLIAGISAIIGLIILIILKAAHPVIVVAVAYSTIAIVVALITLYWKISIHTAVFSSVATVLFILYGTAYWWLFLVIIPLAWSRVYRKHHTVLQTAAGAVLAFSLTTAVFLAFGYL